MLDPSSSEEDDDVREVTPPRRPGIPAAAAASAVMPVQAAAGAGPITPARRRGYGADEFSRSDSAGTAASSGGFAPAISVDQRSMSTASRASYDDSGDNTSVTGTTPSPGGPLYHPHTTSVTTAGTPRPLYHPQDTRVAAGTRRPGGPLYHPHTTSVTTAGTPRPLYHLQDTRVTAGTPSPGGPLYHPHRPGGGTSLPPPPSPSLSASSPGGDRPDTAGLCDHVDVTDTAGLSDVDRSERDEEDRRRCMQIYVFVIRCIAYPFNAKQPTDMVRRQAKVTRQQMHSIRDRFQVILSHTDL